ncbi:MAG: response regulator [Myxococcota bacterium]|nr:response regulator [Myxococcota bacterium]
MTGGELTRPYRILLVEDHLPDILLVRRVLKPNDDVQLVVVRDGITALDYLDKRPPYESASRPDLILLDLNLPRKDGREVLIEIKANPGLRRIPVLIIGSSVEPSSSELSGFESDDNGHSSVLHRPHRLARLQTLIESIREFWVEPALSPWHSSEVAEA